MRTDSETLSFNCLQTREEICKRSHPAISFWQPWLRLQSLHPVIIVTIRQLGATGILQSEQHSQSVCHSHCCQLSPHHQDPKELRWKQWPVLQQLKKWFIPPAAFSLCWNLVLDRTVYVCEVEAELTRFLVLLFSFVTKVCYQSSTWCCCFFLYSI